MACHKDVLVIVPAYNEQENIVTLVGDLRCEPLQSMADCLVVDDGSTDATAAVARQAGATVVSHFTNLGYGCALQTGYKYALQRGYSYIVQMDADGQHDVCNLAPIVTALRTPDADGNFPDLVVGSRFLECSLPYRQSPLRLIGIRIFRSIIHRASGQIITDPTSGLQGLSIRAVQYYAGYGRFDDKYPDANVLMQMLLLGFRVREIPVVMHPRHSGKSMHAGVVRPVLYVLRMTASLLAVWARVRIFHMDQQAILFTK